MIKICEVCITFYYDGQINSAASVKKSAVSEGLAFRISTYFFSAALLLPNLGFALDLVGHVLFSSLFDAISKLRECMHALIPNGNHRSDRVQLILVHCDKLGKRLRKNWKVVHRRENCKIY